MSMLKVTSWVAWQEWSEDEKKPPRGIATRIINHHILFGKNGNKRGTSCSSQETTSLGNNGDSGSESSPIRLKDFKGHNHKAGMERSNLVS
ncbi:unnamed protein product [Pieris macdunnoughi]|uniref:Uncharacterized protein n=1 Tax=Pieris macdunnoughi TaxID=345717 RepID=A0A821WJ37_9NEOP|nr:unnamed protein product [Pieris macdunnoughi]